MELFAARAMALQGRALGVGVGWWDTEEWFVDVRDAPIGHEASVIRVEPIVRDLSSLEIAPYQLQCMVETDQLGRLRAPREACPAGPAASFPPFTCRAATRPRSERSSSG